MWDIFVTEAVIGGVSSGIARLDGHGHAQLECQG